MGVTEAMIRERAFGRIAQIFKVPAEQLRLDAKFGEGLRASFVSDFKHNEYDRVDQDIHDVADRKITRELGNGSLTIQTVGEYCDHMVRCYETKPEDVKKILGLS